jgi:hypothetical protein
MSREAPSEGSGLSVQTLLISSLAAVAAAIVVPMFWEKGSLIATAITPVIVAIVSEALKRPARVISSTAPRVTRRSATGAAVRSRQPAGVGARGEGPEQLGGGISREDPFGLRAAQRPRRRRRPLRIAVITGLVAAVIGAGVVTASELALFQHSVSSGKERTSLFGGSTKPQKKRRSQSSPQASPTAQPGSKATPAPTSTATPAPSATPTPPAAASPTPPAPTPTQ